MLVYSHQHLPDSTKQAVNKNHPAILHAFNLSQLTRLVI